MKNLKIFIILVILWAITRLPIPSPFKILASLIASVIFLYSLYTDTHPPKP